MGAPEALQLLALILHDATERIMALEEEVARLREAELRKERANV